MCRLRVQIMHVYKASTYMFCCIGPFLALPILGATVCSNAWGLNPIIRGSEVHPLRDDNFIETAKGYCIYVYSPNTFEVTNCRFFFQC